MFGYQPMQYQGMQGVPQWGAQPSPIRGIRFVSGEQEAAQVIVPPGTKARS